MMRVRSYVLSLLAVLTLAGGGFAAAAAQEATPEMAAPPDALFADTFGLPELAITLTDAGFEGVPAETAAGLYVVTFTNDSSMEFGAVGFLQLSEGTTVDDLAALAEMMAEPEGEPEMEMASPEAMAGMDMASPPAGEDPLAWLYEAYIAGGVGAAPGQTTQGIVELRPGNYAVWADDPTVPVAPVALTVSGDAAASPVAGQVTADVTVTETGTSGSFDFSVTGTFAVGPNVVEIFNDSDQPHFVEVLYSPDPVTEEQVGELLLVEEGATPPAGLPDPSQWQSVLYAAVQSAGSTQYVAANIDQPGYLIFLCFVPDPQQGGIPHAFEGMIEVVQVT